MAEVREVEWYQAYRLQAQHDERAYDNNASNNHEKFLEYCYRLLFCLTLQIPPHDICRLHLGQIIVFFATTKLQ